MKGVQIEALQERHLPGVLQVEKLCQSSPWSERSFRNELDHEFGVFIVAIIDREIRGFAGEWILADEAHVTTLAVAPDFRRKGMGQLLMKELLDQAQDRGATCSTLEVRASNVAAIKLYESLGYVGVGTRKNYYPDNKEDALVMWLYELKAMPE